MYSTYGPTADTGGLATRKAPTIYRAASVAELLRAVDEGTWPPLPGPGDAAATERP